MSIPSWFQGFMIIQARICIFMEQEKLNSMFDLGDDYFSGYFSNTEITDIDTGYIGSVIDLDALTKISRQLDVSMGSMMGMINVFAVVIYMILIYLLSKIIIEKNAQSISMTKILGYTNGEISRLYILSTSLVVILWLLLSLPIETAIMEVLFREMMLASISGCHTLDRSEDLCRDVWCGNSDLCSDRIAGIQKNLQGTYGGSSQKCRIKSTLSYC